MVLSKQRSAGGGSCTLQGSYVASTHSYVAEIHSFTAETHSYTPSSDTHDVGSDIKALAEVAHGTIVLSSGNALCNNNINKQTLATASITPTSANNIMHGCCMCYCKTGTAANNTFTVRLEHPSGTILASEAVTLNNSAATVTLDVFEIDVAAAAQSYLLTCQCSVAQTTVGNLGAVFAADAKLTGAYTVESHSYTPSSHSYTPSTDSYTASSDSHFCA